MHLKMESLQQSWAIAQASSAEKWALRPSLSFMTILMHAIAVIGWGIGPPAHATITVISCLSDVYADFLYAQSDSHHEHDRYDVP